jgi:hypothetical protein
MQRTHSVLRTFGILACLTVAALAFPLVAHAGVHVSIGLGIPVYPAPVVVAPAPVVVAPPPAVVYPAPVIVVRPPVVAVPPPVVYGGPRVLIQGSYGYPYRPWRHYGHRW